MSDRFPTENLGEALKIQNLRKILNSSDNSEILNLRQKISWHLKNSDNSRNSLEDITRELTLHWKNLNQIKSIYIPLELDGFPIIYREHSITMIVPTQQYESFSLEVISHIFISIK